MPRPNIKDIKLDWNGAQSDAQASQESLLALVRFLARQAAERDYHRKGEQEEGAHD